LSLCELCEPSEWGVRYIAPPISHVRYCYTSSGTKTYREWSDTTGLVCHVFRETHCLDIYCHTRGGVYDAVCECPAPPPSPSSPLPPPPLHPPSPSSPPAPLPTCNNCYYHTNNGNSGLVAITSTGAAWCYNDQNQQIKSGSGQITCYEQNGDGFCECLNVP
jgi:hypothetical protein